MSFFSFLEDLIEGDRQFRNEMRAGRREAGEKYHKDNVADTATSDTAEHEQPNNTSSKKPENNNKSENSKKSENNNKSEQQKKAEAQAPEEATGAEKIKGSSKANTETEAAKSGSVNPNSKPDTIDFSAFGTTINMNAMNDTGNQVNPSNNSQQANNHNPYYDKIVGNGNVGAGFDNMNSYMNHINQQQAKGNHRVDQPKQPPKPKPKKAEPDNSVNIEGAPTPQEVLKVIPHMPPRNLNDVDVIQATPPVTEAASDNNTSAIPLFDNSYLYKDYPYIKEIESIALENGFNIKIGVRVNTGIIDAYICDASGNAIPNKGFSIDPGFIIDRRKKVFPGIFAFFEGIQAYPLFIPSGEKDKKNVLNTNLIKGLIVGGNEFPEEKKGMYTPDFRALNCIVALITMPTKELSNQERKAIQSRLVDLYKSNLFDQVLAIDPGVRFRIAEYDKASGAFILDSYGVTKNYGGEVMGRERIQVRVTKNGAKILRGDAVVAVPE